MISPLISYFRNTQKINYPLTLPHVMLKRNGITYETHSNGSISVECGLKYAHEQKSEHDTKIEDN